MPCFGAVEYCLDALQGSQVDSRPFQKWENDSKANERHRAALIKLQKEMAEQEQKEKQHIFARFVLGIVISAFTMILQLLTD
jgi:hypothetical protein